MKTIEEIERILRERKQSLVERFGVREIGVFGSFVRRENRADSDLDLLVDFSRPIGLLEFLSLEQHLAEILQVKVDLVAKHALKPRIGRNILAEVIYV